MNQSTTQQKKLPKLTKKQEGFVRDFVHTGNGQEAALKNYDIKGDDKENIARSIASENLTKLNVAVAVQIEQETLKSALKKQGVTPEKIAKKVDELLEAVTPIYKNNNETGEIELVGEKPDFQAIDKGLKHATTIYGVEDLDDKNPKLQTTYNFIFSPKTQAEIKAIEQKIKDRLINPDVQET